MINKSVLSKKVQRTLKRAIHSLLSSATLFCAIVFVCASGLAEAQYSYDFTAATYAAPEGNGTNTTSVVNVTRTAAAGGAPVQVHGTAGEGGTVILNAPAGYTFTSVAFASYGLPTGSAGSYAIDPGCHSPTSASQVAAAFVGQTSGSIPATNAVFGDPCPGIGKRLYISLVATSGAASSVNVVLNSGPTNGATPGSDFTSGTVTVNFALGETTKSVPIQFLGDTVVEPDETIALSFASNAGTTQPTAVLTITNDDFATAPSVTTNAASGVATTTATLNGSVTPNGAATNAYFQYATNFGLSGATTTGNQATGSGNSAVSVNQPLSGLDPHTQYFYRAVAINSVNTTNGSVLNFTTGNTNPTAPNAMISATTGDQQTYTLPYPVTDADGDAVTVNTVTPGANLTVNNTSGNQVTFTPAGNFAGQSSISYSVKDAFGGTASGTITVNISDNDNPVVTAPADITVPSTSPAGAVVTFSPSASDNVGVTSLVSSPASGSTFPLGMTTVTITAQDAAGNAGMDTFVVTVYQAPSFYDFTTAGFTTPEGNVANTSNVVTVTRSGNTWDSTSASLVLAAGPTNPATSGTDYTAGPVTVNFAGGETNKAALIGLLGDAVVELNETLALSFASDSGSAQPTATLTVENDDSAQILIGTASVVEGDTGTAQLVFDVTLDSDVDVPVAVDFATADGTATVVDSDYVSNTGTLNFSGVIGQTLQITVNVNGDCIEEDDEEMTVGLSNVQAGGREASITIPTGGGGGPETVFANVPEAADYELVYDLTMGNSLDWDTTVPYTTNNSAAISNGSFDRIAYYLELDGNFVFVSVDAFTNDATLIGVPGTAGSDTVFQQLLSNMNVASNVPGIVTGSAITTGNIEFWKFNYGGANANGIPGASESTFDFGDTNNNDADHGSMQIHNHGAGQTLFAINNFNRSNAGEMGIGNSLSGSPDWTSTGNGASYTSKILQILVRPNGGGGGGGGGTGTILNDDAIPEITLPGIADATIYTATPQTTVALFPHFEDGDDADNTLTYAVVGNTDTALVQTSSINSADGILTLDTPCTLRGSADITIRVTDPCGQTVEDTFTVTVIDNVPPVLELKDIVLTISPELSETSLAPFAYSAIDKVDGTLPASCVPDGLSPFPVGVTPITCSATDMSGNTVTSVFNVVVLVEHPTPGPRYLDVVGIRGDAVTGQGVPQGATLFSVNNAYLNNSGEILFDGTLTGAGTSNLAVFTGPVEGPHSIVALKGNATAGGGVYGFFSNLSLNDDGDCGFQSAIGSNAGQFVDQGSGVGQAAVKGGLAPVGGGETYATLQKPALASDGTLLVTGNLQLGSGAGVTVNDDTIVAYGSSAVLAREGAPSSIPATAYGQLHLRVVASEDNSRYAFSAYLVETVFDASDNTALFTGILGGGAPSMVIREGDEVDGGGGATFSSFLGETVNSAGEIVIRANVGGPSITAANNEGLWTNAGNTSAPPVLVAREGDIAPCLPNSLTAFSRFSNFFIGDDGSVCFCAFLKNATAIPVVNSNNDGSLWRWSNGRLHLIAREGDEANNTSGSVIRSIGNCTYSGSGAVAYDVSLFTGIGDTTTTTNLAVYVDRGAVDPAPLLVLRRSDSFDFEDTTYTVAGIKLSVETNSGGGTGGYGRAINDAGEIILNLALDNNKSGIFVLGAPPQN
jgi:hypothetical protein